MSSPLLLEAALNNTSIPHQPYVLISDEPTFGGVPLLREMIRRSLRRQAPTLLVSILRAPATYLLTRSSLPSSSHLEIVDLTDRIPGYDNADFEGVKADILQAVQKLGPKVEIFIDAIDILAEDYTSAAVLGLVRALMKQIKLNKAPSRLTLMLSAQSSLYSSLLPPALSPSLTQLQPHPLHLLATLSTAYLAPISAEPRFTDLLEMASDRHLGQRMAWLGESSLGDWSAASSQSGGSGKGKGNSLGRNGPEGVAAVRVTMRKATGGAKGMSRSLEGLALPASSSSSSSSIGSSDLAVRPLASFMDLQPFSNPVAPPNQRAPTSSDPSQSTTPAPVQHTTHSALDLSFSLSLTDEQRRRRDRVPIPYVHEGEGVEVGWDDDEEDEDDDEEI